MNEKTTITTLEGAAYEIYLNVALESGAVQKSEYDVYGAVIIGDVRVPFIVAETDKDGQWLCLIPPLKIKVSTKLPYQLMVRRKATGHEWLVLSGDVHLIQRIATAENEKLGAPVLHANTTLATDSHHVTVTELHGVAGVDGAQGERGEKGDKGDPGPPGEGGMTEEERSKLNGAAQRGGDNTFTASNTFTGSVDMSTAQVTPPEGWNVGELTAEQVQSVVPIAWQANQTTKGYGTSGFVVGQNSSTGHHSVALGDGCSTANNSVVVGKNSNATGTNNQVILGWGCQGTGLNSVLIGHNGGNGTIKSNARTSITIGAAFSETTDSGNVPHTCTTEGTGSITIGAGANTLNNGTTESSNSITIGCKASNSGADSVVIGAQASGAAAGSVVMGAGAKNSATAAVALGRNVSCTSYGSVAVGAQSLASGYYAAAFGTGANASTFACTVLGGAAKGGTYSTSVGFRANAKGNYCNAFGMDATANDYGATVIRSTAEDGSYTQLYFSGANTPLANTYHGGAPMLGYVTKDSAGNIVAAGTRSLIDLLTDNSTFAPASLDENGEWVMPRVFHPSDLDMPQEEPQEPEEYTPLPVWPIVEPDVPEMEE